MITDRRPREYSASLAIRLWMFIALLPLILCLTISCKNNNSQTTDPASAATLPEEDSQAFTTDTTDIDDGHRDEGIVYNGSQAYARAIGKAPKGRDISLARDSAAASARGNLLRFLKEAGYVADSTDTLQGATIERYWKKGNFIYAISVVPLVALSPPLNGSSAPPSKEPEGKRPEAHGTPRGGSIP
jgi:hypothetical protein